MTNSNSAKPRKGNHVVPAYSHVGLCVADLEKSMRFYGEGLGFSTGLRIENGSELCHFVGVPQPMTMISQFMTLGGLNLELLAFPSPGTVARAEVPRPLNRVGMTHLSFYVSDSAATAKKLVALGGHLHEETRIVQEKFAGSDVSVNAVFCTDPDGTRVELMCFSENFPGFVPD